MQKDELMVKLEKARSGDASISEIMEVLSEFYLSFSRHIKEVKDIVHDIKNNTDVNNKQIIEINEKLKCIELSCVNPIQRVLLSHEDEEVN